MRHSIRYAVTAALALASAGVLAQTGVMAGPGGSNSTTAGGTLGTTTTTNSSSTGTGSLTPASGGERAGEVSEEFLNALQQWAAGALAKK